MTDGDYKPVPDDLLTVLDRLVDAAEEVIALYALDWETEDEFWVAMDRLSKVVTKALTYLERTA